MIMPFGKHKGEMLTDVPTDYIGNFLVPKSRAEIERLRKNPDDPHAMYLESKQQDLTTWELELERREKIKATVTR